MIDLTNNYIYIYHLDEWLLLPTYPETVNDTLMSTFSQQDALSRTAPIYAYSHSGPREMQITLDLHRDMVNDLNINTSNMKIEKLGDDYVDTLIKKLQAIALPKYIATSKTVNPPMVAVQFGEELFIKGIVNGGVNVTYEKPIMSNNKYARVQISFKVSETTPFDAETVAREGSFRGITSTFKNGIYKED